MNKDYIGEIAKLSNALLELNKFIEQGMEAQKQAEKIRAELEEMMVEYMTEPQIPEPVLLCVEIKDLPAGLHTLIQKAILDNTL